MVCNTHRADLVSQAGYTLLPNSNLGTLGYFDRAQQIPKYAQIQQQTYHKNLFDAYNESIADNIALYQQSYQDGVQEDVKYGLQGYKTTNYQPIIRLQSIGNADDGSTKKYNATSNKTSDTTRPIKKTAKETLLSLIRKELGESIERTCAE